MKQWLKILITLVAIGLIVAGILWWIPFKELSKGQLAIIGVSNSGPSVYLLDPDFRSWHRLPTNNLYPRHIAWSPDGQNIAFTYSASNDNDPNNVLGVAILSLNTMQTKKVYIANSNETLNVVTWSLDGQSLIFDIYKNNVLTAFQWLDIVTGKLRSIPFPKNIQPQYFGINHLEVAQNNDYIIGGSDGIFIASPNLENLQLVTEVGDLDGFFLTPDGKEITTPCNQSPWCNYDIKTNQLTNFYPGDLSDYGIFRAGNWSHDEEDIVYLSGGGGEGDPQYIRLLDTRINRTYTIYKFPHYTFNPLDILVGRSPFNVLGVSQLAWYSK